MPTRAQGEAATAGTDIVVSGTVLPITQRARAMFQQEQVNLLYASRAPRDCPMPIFHGFLEIAARYELDPFTGEIWLALMSGTNGSNSRIATMVGRDGYLKVARRDPEFVDVDADVVCENDAFKVARGADGTRTIEHSYGNPKDRGAVLGAYAVLMRRGRPDRYFYAPATEYARDAAKSAWRFMHSMLIKCAISYICRVTYGVSGAVPADEVSGGLALPGETRSVIEGTVASPPATPQLPDALQALVERAHAIDPQQWRPHEVAARLPHPDDDTYAPTVDGLAASLRRWLDEHPPDDVTEAEVVDGGRDELAADQQPRATDAFTEAMVEHDAGGDAAGAADDDPRAECERRWHSTDPADVAWRQEVDVLLNRHADLEAESDSLPGQQQDDVDAELRKIDGDLDALGVPGGWFPASEAAS